MISINSIYEGFYSEIKSIENFLNLTKYSFRISKLLSKEHGYDSIQTVDLERWIPDLLSEMNVADIEIGKKRFVTVEEFARLENMPINEVENNIKSKIYLELYSYKDQLYLTWPPHHVDSSIEVIKLYPPDQETREIEQESFQNFNDLLEAENVDFYDNEAQVMLHLINQLGEVGTSINEATQKLHSSCYLLIWIAFEDFLKAMIEELYRIFPEKVINRNKDEVFSLENIFTYSNRFTDINNLSEIILKHLLSKAEQSKEKIHAQIQFLKDNFLIGIKPYEAPIIIGEENKFTSYLDIDEFRKIRNYIVHNNSMASDDFFKKHPNVPKDGNKIIIESSFLKAYIAKIRAIANHIYSSLNDLV
jgi:hypothetical protein